MTRHHVLPPLGALATAFALAAPAMAAATSYSDSGATSALEEIVVTARKRPERFSDVPASLTVLNADVLATMGATSLADVELRLPNFGSDDSTFSAFTSRYVRGLNAGARNIGFDSGYAVFVDGVYSGRYVTANRALQDVERVEYLPGPQGTLFGRNTTLGVVNIVSRAPGPVPTADMGLGFGSDGQRSARISGSMPLAGSWRATASAGRQARDGLVENQYLDRAGNNHDQWDARTALYGDIAGWRTVLAADYYQNTPDLIWVQRLEGLGELPPRVASNDLAGRLDDQDWGTSLTLERDFAAGTLTSITAYRESRSDADADDDAWEVPVQHLVNWIEDTDQFSQELRLSGEAGAYDYLLGAYLLDQQARSSRSVVSFFGQGHVSGAVDSRTYALFATLGRNLTDRLHGELGLRWSDESKDMPYYTQQGGGVLIDFDTQDARSVTSLSPSASLRFALSESTTLYGRYAQAFKSGGFNLDIVTDPLLGDREFDDEQVDTLEAGVRSVLLDGRLRLGAAAFYSKYDDLQVSQYRIMEGATLPTLRITNAASAHTRGVEANAELLLGRWLVTAAVGQTHSEIDDFPDPLGPDTGNYAGNSLGGPDWTTSVMVQYAQPLGRLGELTLSAEHLFQDRLGGALNDDPLTWSDPLSEVNLRAALAFGENQRWQVSAWVDNVLDADHVVQRARNAAPGLMMLIGYPPEIADSTVGMYNDPRTFGLELSVAL